jgi:hypothetical protein
MERPWKKVKHERTMRFRFSIVVGFRVHCPASAQVERIWLTHRTNDPSKLVVNWTTKLPGDSKVRFGLTREYEREVVVPGSRTLHQVEIPLLKKDVLFYYAVSSGMQISVDAKFQGYPTDVLRVAVVANWQGKPDLKAIQKDRVHLLLTAGDNINSIWEMCGVGNKDCINPYAALIDAYPDLFQSVPFMPVLGNHDREIRPRGNKPPAEPVYDIDATAFCKFFPLPGERWKWYFDVPDFKARFIALDFNHISDRGTTWQSCHAFDKDSVQFQWYKKLMDNRPPGFVVTLYNERNASIRNQEKGAWHQMFRKGDLAITGFGHFAERAELDGLTYLNTSLQGRGNKYPDPASKVLKSENNYVLMTFTKATGILSVELKSLEGTVLDRVALRAKE